MTYSELKGAIHVLSKALAEYRVKGHDMDTGKTHDALDILAEKVECVSSVQMFRDAIENKPNQYEKAYSAYKEIDKAIQISTLIEAGGVKDE